MADSEGLTTLRIFTSVGRGTSGAGTLRSHVAVMQEKVEMMTHDSMPKTGIRGKTIHI
jgi:hypothetical protein